jgi:hypothetical protein
MEIALVAAVALLAGIGPQAGEARQEADMKVTACTGIGVGLDFAFVKLRAQRLATQIFANVGVTIDWRSSVACPGNALRISFSSNTPPNLFPNALARARPFEGIHIEVFYDRVRETHVAPDRLLAHVLVHEITHMLQRSNGHAQSGMMKVCWEREDFLAMRENTLSFTPVDLELIQDGFADRASKTPSP